jgi:hypothetical protein
MLDFLYFVIFYILTSEVLNLVSLSLLAILLFLIVCCFKDFESLNRLKHFNDAFLKFLIIILLMVVF